MQPTRTEPYRTVPSRAEPYRTMQWKSAISVGRFRSLCGGGVRIRGWVGIRQSGSDFNEGMHNLAGVQNSAQHRHTKNHPRLGCSFSLTTYTMYTPLASFTDGFLAENTEHNLNLGAGLRLLIIIIIPAGSDRMYHICMWF